MSELEKISAVKDKSQAIGEFLEWARSEGFFSQAGSILEIQNPKVTTDLWQATRQQTNGLQNFLKLT